MDDTERLVAILLEHNVSPDILESGLGAFSDDVKNGAVARIAAAPGPPQAEALARLPLIRTAENAADIAAAMRAGLTSPDPAARKFAIYGLEALGLPDAADAAIAALGDADDQVVVAASSVLLPHAEQDPEIADALRAAYETRYGQNEFHASVNLLKARLPEPERPA